MSDAYFYFCLTRTIWVHYSEGPLFWKYIIPTNSNPKPNPKLNPNPKPNPNANPNLKPKSNPSIVARICTMNFRNSGPLE